MTHIALLLKHSKAFPLTGPYLNITPDREEEHCKCTEREVGIYGMKNQETGLSELGVTTKPWGFSWIFSEEKGGDLQLSELGWGVKDSTVAFWVSPILLVHVLVTR